MICHHLDIPVHFLKQVEDLSVLAQHLVFLRDVLAQLVVVVPDMCRQSSWLWLSSGARSSQSFAMTLVED